MEERRSIWTVVSEGGRQTGGANTRSTGRGKESKSNQQRGGGRGTRANKSKPTTREPRASKDKRAGSTSHGAPNTEGKQEFSAEGACGQGAHKGVVHKRGCVQKGLGGSGRAQKEHRRSYHRTAPKRSILLIQNKFMLGNLPRLHREIVGHPNRQLVPVGKDRKPGDEAHNPTRLLSSLWLLSPP